MSETANTAVAAAVVAHQAGLFTKLAFMFGAGIVGAAIMASFDPPATRKELFKQAMSAGVGSMLFGGPAVSILGHYVSYLDLANAAPQTYFEWAVPVYFTVGALSWGAFSALAKIRGLLRDRAGDAFAARYLAPEVKPLPPTPTVVPIPATPKDS